MNFSTIKSVLFAAGMLTAVANANAAILTATDSTFGSFDASSGNRTFLLGSGLVSDVNIAITFAKCDDPSIGANGTTCLNNGTPYFNEIVFRLTNPFGTTVNLISRDTYDPGSQGSGRITINFDDEAANTVGGPTLVGGNFRPIGSLATFDGSNAAGLWTLFIQDTARSDRLDYFSSTLTVTTRGVVSEPGSLALLGLGIAGLGMAGRRKKA